MAKLRSRIIAALDIGTTKVVCMIAEEEIGVGLNIIGIGHQLSQGIKSGLITNIRLAEQSIRSAVSAAEQMAGINIDKVIINVNGCKQQSHYVTTEMETTGQEISDKDVNRLLDQGYQRFNRDGYDVLHCVPLDYSIDDSHGIKDPVGLYGNRLQSELHVVTASQTSLLNITNCVAKCHLDIEDYIVSAYASGYACLNSDEKELGVTLIEFGGGTTSVAVFKHGNIIFTDVIPIGGTHITNDIALGLSTNLESAERIKTLYGNVLNASKDDQEMIDVPYIGDGNYNESNHAPRSHLVNIIRPRVDEILELLGERLSKAGFLHHTSSIVLSGGGSQLAGLKQYIGQVFQKQTRMGVPKPINNLAESTKGPAFSTCIGMMHYIFDKYYDSYEAKQSLTIMNKAKKFFGFS